MPRWIVGMIQPGPAIAPLVVGWVAVRKSNSQMFNDDTICQSQWHASISIRMHYCRAQTPGATDFFTAVTDNRQHLFKHPAYVNGLRFRRLNQSIAQCRDCRLNAIIHRELVHNAAQVSFHSADTEKEF